MRVYHFWVKFFRADDWSDRRAPKEMWDDLYAAPEDPKPSDGEPRGVAMVA
jgi:hypothetical protein